MSDRTTKSFKLALTSSAASVILAAGLSSPVRAQDGEEVAQLETIIVTGSRIARPDLEASTPIAVLGSEKIGLAGQTNISDLLRRQPAFGHRVPTLSFGRRAITHRKDSPDATSSPGTNR